MSTNVSKAVIRFHIPALDDASDQTAYLYFASRLGEPDDWVNRDENGQVYYFSYKADLRPVRQSRGGSNYWGMELVLCEHIPEYGTTTGAYPHMVDGKMGISFSAFEPFKERLIEMGFKKADIETAKIYAYTWYNGTDEPISFE